MKIGYLMQSGVRDIWKDTPSGPANHVRQVIKGLQRQGHQVRLLFRADGKTWKSDDLVKYDPVIVTWVDQGPVRWFERLIRRIQSEFQLPYFTFFDSLRFALACCQELRGYDLLYERITWVGYGGGMASRWLQIPLVLEENGNQLAMMDMMGNAPHGIQRKLESWLMQRAVSLAAHVVASGDGWREHFIERFGVKAEMVTTVENGTALVHLLNREVLRSFRNIEEDNHALTLVYLGGFYPWHGVNILIRAFSRACKQGLNLRLLLIGSGIGVNEAESLADNLGMNNKIHFAGNLLPEEFAPLLADANIGLSPYCGWVEYSGLKLLDYKAAGLAIIASGLDGKPATIKDGEMGYVVPPCDEDALYDAIVKLASNKKLIQRMGRISRLSAEETNTWEHTVNDLERVFIHVLSKDHAKLQG